MYEEVNFSIFSKGAGRGEIIISISFFFGTQNVENCGNESEEVGREERGRGRVGEREGRRDWTMKNKSGLENFFKQPSSSCCLAFFYEK